MDCTKNKRDHDKWVIFEHGILTMSDKQIVESEKDILQTNIFTVLVPC